MATSTTIVGSRVRATTRRTLVTAALVLAALALAPPRPGPAAGSSRWPLAGTVSMDTTATFDVLRQRLRAAVRGARMGIVAEASASGGAAARGITIPGNAVVMVFRNDFAVRMLRASVPAGFEAPLRFYLTARADGGATLTYRRPSAVFAPYANAELDALARELDEVFARIARAAIAE